ncbi:MAG: hypothetical protein LKK00_06960 [Intestinimonas sp.]|nr:hypothetical protein [Intestinimonas sp.]
MRKRKLAAPIVITVLSGLWFSSWLVMLFLTPGLRLAVRLIGAVIPLALLGASIYVLIERIHEIRSGEEDDLSQY